MSRWLGVAARHNAYDGDYLYGGTMTDHRTDFVNDDSETMARAVFSGLRPSPRFVFEDAPTSRSSNPTVPILLAGTMTLTGAIAIIDAAPKPEHKPDGSSARG